MSSHVSKRWFTLVEVIIVATAFAIIIVGVVAAINRAFVFMNNSRLSVRAANFAREWMEMMFNIRDTNWRKYSWERDAYWLNVWSWTDNFQQWVYVLLEETGALNPFIYAEKITLSNNCNNVDKFYSDDGFWWEDCESDRNKVALNFSWSTYKYYSWGIQTWDMQELLIWQWLEFYRMVRVFGVYEKNVGNSAEDISAWSSALTNWTPAEMRFCVKVFYRSEWKHNTELCWLMTNFQA